MSELDLLDSTNATAPTPFDEEFPEQSSVSAVQTENAATTEQTSANPFDDPEWQPTEQDFQLFEENKETLAALAFVYSHPEYFPTPENQQAIQSFLDESGLELNRANLETAYSELRAAGALKSKPVTRTSQRLSQPITKRTTQRPTQRPAQSAPTITADDIRNLPMDEARARLSAAMHYAKKSDNRVPQSQFEEADDFFTEDRLAQHVSPEGAI